MPMDGAYIVYTWYDSECDPEEEEATDCSDCVSQTAYDELYEMVQAQAASIAALEESVAELEGLEETVTEVDTQLTNLATCLSYDSSYTEPETTTTMEPTME